MGIAERPWGPMAPMQPIAGASAWHGNELAGNDAWVHVLSRQDVAEIEAAVGAVEAGGTAIVDVRKEDFPLPTVGPAFARLRAEIVDGRGFVLVRGLPVDRWDRAKASLAFWGLGLHLGEPVSQNMQGHLLGHVKDIGGDFDDPNARAGYQSRAKLPFHTDLGADVVGLLCLHPGAAGGESRVVSAHALYNAMLARRPDLARVLTQPVHRDRRGEVPPGKAPTYAVPVFCFHRGYMTCTFVRRFIDSAPRHAGVPAVTAQLAEALDLLEALAEEPGFRLDMDFRRGDIQFVNNLTTLHGRNAFSDPAAGGGKRHLLRLWLTVPDGWPLPSSHYDRFGSVDDAGRPRGMTPADVPLSAPLDVS